MINRRIIIKIENNTKKKIKESKDISNRLNFINKDKKRLVSHFNSNEMRKS